MYFQNEAAIGLEPQTNNYEPGYQIIRPIREELPDM